jgi:hypothetical protein
MIYVVRQRILGLAKKLWFQDWIPDHLPFGQHRKLLLRWALAQAEVLDISLGLPRIRVEMSLPASPAQRA